jgi:pilus biogenesis lipoprotein CpaD
MTMAFENIFRAAALVSILAAGSCAATNDGQSISQDGSLNHPIAVEPSYKEIKMHFAGGAGGISADDAVTFDNFLADFRAHGNGSLGISVPDGAPSRAAITWFAERAAATGISKDKILVSTHEVANNDFRVDISYISYSARTDPCGDWSERRRHGCRSARPLGPAPLRSRRRQSRRHHHRPLREGRAHRRHQTYKRYACGTGRTWFWHRQSIGHHHGRQTTHRGNASGELRCCAA